MRRLPLSMARCEPERPCPQAQRCARFCADSDDFHAEIDASGCVGEHGCGLFIDVRALALVAPPVRRAAPPVLHAPATWLGPLGAAL